MPRFRSRREKLVSQGQKRKSAPRRARLYRSGVIAAAPNAGPLITKPLGGVKLACGACRLAFEAYNREIAAPLGYRVKVSGTHGGFYNGWQAPPVIRANARALAVVTAGLPKGASLSSEGVLLGVDESGSRYHDPDESDSEWEEVPD